MPLDDLQSFVEKLRSLARLGDPEVVREELDGIMPEDLAEAVARMDPEESVELLKLLDHELAGNILIELPTDNARPILNELPDYTVAMYLDVLPMDDALDLREELGPDRFDDLLEIIPKEDATEIRRLMSWPEDSVGRIMTERFFEVGPDTPMTQLLEDIRSASDEKYETVNDVYVLSPERHLLGLFSLRKGIRAAPQTPASEIMRTEVITCNARDDMEDAARQMARYGFYSLPVLDDRGRMVGIFTGDDAQSVLRDAETEDVHALGAVTGDAENYLSLRVRRLAAKRLPWLLGLFLADTLTGSVMRHYGPMGMVTYFIPLLIGTGGNSGSQTTTMITRALAVGDIQARDLGHVIFKEVRTGLLIGGCLGLLGFVWALRWNSPVNLALAISVALPSIVIWSSLVGSMLPITAKKVGIDPAVMSAPFISTFVDATGMIIYFEVVKLFFHSGVKV